MTIKLNMIPSPDDSRDKDVAFQLNALGTITIPKTLDYRKDLLPIRNQGEQGACYAFSGASMKEWQDKKEIGLDEYLSPQFFYNHRANLYDDDPTNDSGMYSRNVMKMLQTIGFCLERNYPYGTIESKENIDPELYEEAKNHLITSYARVNTIEDCKKSLVVNGPCLLTVPVYNQRERMWKRESNAQQRQGGHAMCIIGYNKEGFIVRNSWGTQWGDMGHCIFPYEDWGLHFEVWTTTDAKSVPVKRRNTRLARILARLLRRWLR